MATFYAFKYHGNHKTTTGTPNAKTGRMSIAGDLAAFSTKADRAKNMKTGFVPVTARQARDLCAGMTCKDFNEHVEMIKDQWVYDQNPDQFQVEGQSLYEYDPGSGAYIHVYSNPNARNMRELIDGYYGYDT